MWDPQMDFVSRRSFGFLWLAEFVRIGVPVFDAACNSRRNPNGHLSETGGSDKSIGLPCLVKIRPQGGAGAAPCEGHTKADVCQRHTSAPVDGPVRG